MKTCAIGLKDTLNVKGVIESHCQQLCPQLVGLGAVHIRAIGPAFFAPFARLLGMKVIVTQHGADYERQKWNWNAIAKTTYEKFQLAIQGGR